MADVDVKGKTYLVTGATTGLGFYSSVALLKNGANVIITARSKERAEETISKLKSESGSSSIRFLVMDQSNLEDVKTAADEFISWGERLDGLMLNAAVFGGEYTHTKQGHELHFGVNHLSHYLFVELLKEKLIESAPARVVILSSESHRQPKITGIKYEELAVESKEGSLFDMNQRLNLRSLRFSHTRKAQLTSILRLEFSLLSIYRIS